MSNVTVYISTGELEGFYTLRTFYRKVSEGGEVCCVDSYRQNLSTDWGTAFDKAKAYAKRTGANFNPQRFELDEFNKLRGEQLWMMIKNDLTLIDIIPFGKNAFKKLDDVDIDYLWWMANSWTNTETKNIHFRVALAIFLANSGTEDPAVTREIEVAEREAQQRRDYEKAEPVPITDGRIRFTGKIVHTREVENQWGSSKKCLFIDDRGFKLYGGDVGDEGDRVTFIARVEPSSDDTKFGFFKRPTKIDYLESAGAL